MLRRVGRFFEEIFERKPPPKTPHEEPRYVDIAMLGTGNNKTIFLQTLSESCCDPAGEKETWITYQYKGAHYTILSTEAFSDMQSSHDCPINFIPEIVLILYDSGEGAAENVVALRNNVKTHFYNRDSETNTPRTIILNTSTQTPIPLNGCETITLPKTYTKGDIQSFIHDLTPPQEGSQTQMAPNKT